MQEVPRPGARSVHHLQWLWSARPLEACHQDATEEQPWQAVKPLDGKRRPLWHQCAGALSATASSNAYRVGGLPGLWLDDHQTRLRALRFCDRRNAIST